MKTQDQIEINNVISRGMIVSLICVGILIFSCVNHTNTTKGKASPHIVLITLDGVRWQEVFQGLDEALTQNEQYTKNPNLLRERFADSLKTNSRKKLMPFFWNTIVKQGQIYGDSTQGSPFQLENQRKFSYPGYNEILTGNVDETIDSNAKKYNANTTVLEALNQNKNYANRVAAFCSWDVFPFIINDKRSGVLVNAGYMERTASKLSPLEQFVNTYQRKAPVIWESVRLDLFTHLFALEHLKNRKPKALYIAYGETDDFAHQGSYDQYINSLHTTDHFIKEIWEYLNTDPFYKNNTYVFITTDHGRGDGATSESHWTGHGATVAGSKYSWLAVLGPQLNSKGVLRNVPGSATQIAPTLAKLSDLSWSTYSSVLTPFQN